MSKVTFNNSPNPFAKALKEKVDTYFATNQLHVCGNEKLYLKTGLQLSSALACYIILVFYTPAPIIALLICLLFGINLAVLGFNVMHEGGHDSYSKHKWLNVMSAYFLNVMGGNTYYWKLKHNINHHTYTNIDGLDFDIYVGSLMRLHENQTRYWFHKFQHIYWIILYGITYIGWIFIQDFQRYFTGKVAPQADVRKMEMKEHIVFWISKIFYVIAYVVLPIYMVGLVPFLIGFFIVGFSCGLFMSMVFQLAHMVDDTSFPKPDEKSNRIEEEWAIHQVKTTANFAMNNKIVCWLVGGLNFQIEHHLFPRISHIHYPKISEFVRETCKQFNVEYIEHPTLRAAYVAHYNQLRKLGAKD
jgi:linoleoyl-CoA desaturase